jgi:dipeptidyl aminopeptidase/acylaminoacyl peptidase
VWPAFLPDGRHYLYLARRYASRGRSGEIRVAALGGSESRVVLEANSNALFTLPGHLLWWQDGNLRAQRFDTVRLELVGESRAVIPGVRFDPGSGRMAVTVAGNGVLVYQEGGDQEGDELVLLDRAGRQIGAVGAVGTYYGPRLSPDGRRVVVDVSDATNRGDVWVFDVDRSGGTRLSFAPEDETRPRWSPDGRRVVYSSMAGSELMALWVRDLDGGPEPRRMTEDAEEHLRVTDWASNGLVLLDRLGSEGEDLYLCDPGTGDLEPWLATRFVERTASASPDGRFAAYVSEDSGRAEVWVRRFPEADEAWRVSVAGGDWPSWRRDGGELYYVAPDGWLTAVAVEWRQGRQGSEPGFGEPVPLFRFESKAHVDRQYDTLDGERFLVNRSVRTGARTPLTVVQGWQSELERR